MAIDSENKRRSVSNWFCRIPPVPDATISAVDRQHVAGFYSGIAAGAPAVGNVPIFGIEHGEYAILFGGQVMR